MPLSPRSPWSSRSWHGKRWKTGRSGIDVRCSAPVWTFVPGGCSPWPGHGRAYCVSRHRIESVAMSLLIALACKATRRSGRCAQLGFVLCWFCQWCFTFFEPEVYSGRVVGCLPTITGTYIDVCFQDCAQTTGGAVGARYLHLGGLIRQRFRFRLQ